ncbi:MAG TPA: hypothetical protein DCY94_01230 [Firmicutes bacterium]|nr:hypothetical protein [Bacillota bacterium]
MKNYSLWLEKIVVEELRPLKEDMDVDVVIIGGGITGLSMLYQLKNSEKRVILVEANVCGMGVTSKSTAKITPMEQDLYMKIRGYDEAKASLYLKSQLDARDLLVETIRKEEIECDLEKSTSYTYTSDTNKIKDIECEYQFLSQNGLSVDISSNIPFNSELQLAVSYKDAYVFHPLKYINGLKDILKEKVFERSRVKSIIKTEEGYILNINDCTVKTKVVVIATHYPYFFKSFFLPLKSHIEVSFVGAKQEKYEEYNAINIDKPIDSIRYHKSGKKSFKVHLYDSLMSSEVGGIKEHFANLMEEEECEFLWSNNDVMTNDSLPFIGSIKKGDNTFLIGTGYNTWGMTNGTLAGKILADIIEEKENSYRELFDPNRKVNFGKLVSFPLNIFSNAKSFIKSSKGNVNNGEVEYETIDGVEVASVCDKDGVKHTVLAKCPHMKCGLIYNKVEETWDCMCHGSRFDIDGNVLEGPSNENIKFKP